MARQRERRTVEAGVGDVEVERYSGVVVWRSGRGGGQSSVTEQYARASPQITVHGDGGRYDETGSWARAMAVEEMAQRRIEDGSNGEKRLKFLGHTSWELGVGWGDSEKVNRKSRRCAPREKVTSTPCDDLLSYDFILTVRGRPYDGAPRWKY